MPNNFIFFTIGVIFIPMFDIFFDEQIYITILIIAIAFSVLISVLLIIMKIQKEQRDYLSEQRAEIRYIRNSFEKNLYDLTDRMLSNEKRWKDINHLLINSQEYLNIDPIKHEPVYLTDFLKASGINKEELVIDKKLVLVLTPFNDRFKKVYFVIKEACYAEGLKCLRGDEDYVKSDILSHILKLMVKARVVIVNIDGRNANVFYELGLGHAMDKKTILISKSKDNLPFDVQSKYIIIYKDFHDLSKRLKKEFIKIFATE